MQKNNPKGRQRNFLEIMIVATVTLLFALGVAGAADIPDAGPLEEFYDDMAQMYGELKQNTNDMVDQKIKAEIYLSKMKKWRTSYDAEDIKAPCPKNNWRAFYTELTPIHFESCSAWAELGALHTSLLLTDPEPAVYHELQFKELSQSIIEKFERPELNEANNDFFEIQ